MTIYKIFLILPFLLLISCDPGDKTADPPQPPVSEDPGANLREEATAPSIPATSLDVSEIAQRIDDPVAAGKSFEDGHAVYAWEAFIRLNVPLTGPDPKYWESWRQTSTVYLPDGAKPPPWGAVPSIPVKVPDQAKAISDFPATPVYHNLDSTIQVDGLVLLDKFSPAQDVRYQLLMNEDTFEYILDRQFYNVNGQEAAAKAGEPANFPATSWELKTSYIWIGSDQAKYDALSPNYYIVPAYYEVFNDDGVHEKWEVGWAALSGMHIINKTVANWVWISFENVKNAEFTDATIELGIPKDAAEANILYQGLLAREGSIFANYQLVGVQTTFTEPDPDDPTKTKPTLLANSQIESAFQPQSSCITCHDIASITPNGTYFNLVNSSGGDVGYYVGDPPDVTKQGYTRLDFVWSMKRASRAKTNP